jgi:undecaprenyl diphosphate synthase
MLPEAELSSAPVAGAASNVACLDRARVPKHVAIIMDGNGRWAKAQGWQRSIGHAYGSSKVKEVVREADRLGVRVLTLYAFSTENWKRPAGEIAVLMDLLKDYLLRERQELMDNNIRLRALGQVDRIPQEVREILDETIRVTAPNTGMILNFCISYGGRAEIARAAQALCREVAAGRLNPDDVTEEALEAQLYTAGLPDPDLVIRTSGEFRISNFLLWQLAYAEIYVTDTPWPEFEPESLRKAIEIYIGRKRRFGMTDEVRT